ncbi:hypothetical protein Btru_008768 [Bulinus truncatus]|nr:hypothetical protein Btru_008768 [Bulinus truncatus]
MFSRKGATKHCCYGTCNSDSRYDYRPHMKGVKWYPFPKPKRQLQKCARWVSLCRREGFTIESVTKDTYICSKHFPSGNFIEDPFPATANEDEKLKKKCITDNTNCLSLSEAEEKIY